MSIKIDILAAQARTLTPRERYVEAPGARRHDDASMHRFTVASKTRAIANIKDIMKQQKNTI